jgi:hypothetical protein
MGTVDSWLEAPKSASSSRSRRGFSPNKGTGAKNVWQQVYDIERWF